MPPPDPRDDALVGQLRVYLGGGPRRAADTARYLGISQPTFSRLIQRHRDDFLTVGRGRSTEYLARREVAGVGRAVPVYEIDEDGSAREVAAIHAVRATAFFVEARVPDLASGHFTDLPYFLHDMRPAGFLGRLIPRRHPELNAPADVTLWTADHALAYMSRFGWNLPGAFIVGEEAFRLHLMHTREPGDVVSDADRARAYPRFADDTLAAGAPGSSAGGEQPKFLVTRLPSGTGALVKFSPPVVDATSQRIADLLVAEKICLDSMRDRGHAAARADVIEAQGRMFLEVERFDRLAGGGRRGVMSLYALDAQFVGDLQDWDVSTPQLIRLGHVPATLGADVRWRHLFGLLIGNTDMHPGNLSFFVRGTRVTGLAPAYDMAPALYAPTMGHLRTPAFQPPIPSPADAPCWDDACSAAHDAWTRIAGDGRVSVEFRAVAARNAELVAGSRELARLLPRS